MIDKYTAFTSPDFFGRFFEDQSWDGWRAFTRVREGKPLLTSAHKETAFQCTQRNDLGTIVPRECWMIAPRRTGKTHYGAFDALSTCLLNDFTPYLAPGELATYAVVSVVKDQAQRMLRYIRGFLDTMPMFGDMVIRETAEGFQFSNDSEIQIFTRDFKSIRGATLCGYFLDEIAFWQSTEDCARPDKEVVGAIRPSTVSIPFAQGIAFSSPYAKKGELYRNYKKYYALNGAKRLIWHGSIETMNPSLDRELIAEAYEDDPALASAEWGAQFRTDISDLFDPDVLRRCVEAGRCEVPPEGNMKYHGFVDLSGGRQDSAALAISHMHDGIRYLDLLREVKAPHSPHQTVCEFATLLMKYGLNTVSGDAYAAEWPCDEFRKYGINLKRSELNRSGLYLELLGIVNSSQCILLDNERMLSQLQNLERRTRSNGKDSVDHPSGQHDDMANAAAGAIVMCGKRPRRQVGTW